MNLDPVITPTTLFMAGISPAIVSLVRVCGWREEVTRLVSLVVVAGVYFAVQAWEGEPLYPLSMVHVVGLLAAWGTQQSAYSFLWKNSLLDEGLKQAGLYGRTASAPDDAP